MSKKSIYRFKICIFGDGGVGKTTLVHRYTTGVFDDAKKPTLGVEFFVKKINISNFIVSMQIWDFAGQRQFKSLLPSNVSNASGGIFMYDITQDSSVKNLNDWIKVFRETNNETGEVPILLVGGKLDLEDIREISEESGLEIAERNGFFAFIECSSKSGKNVDEIFSNLAQEILRVKKM